MKRFTFFAVVLATGVLTAPVSAADVIASGTLTSTPDGADYDYTITLTNSSSSTDSIGTFWFAWIARGNENFLATSPLSVTNPTGWNDTITNQGANDGYGIQWVSSSPSDNLAIGDSLTFQFESADTPAQISGDSVFYPGTPVETSFVYAGAPFVQPSDVFLVSSVPEPSTLTLGILALVTSYAYARIKRKKTA